MSDYHVYDDAAYTGLAEEFEAFKDKAAAELTAKDALLKECAKMLEQSEWAAFDKDDQRQFCWCCGAREFGVHTMPVRLHKDDCSLDALLRRLSET